MISSISKSPTKMVLLLSMVVWYHQCPQCPVQIFICFFFNRLQSRTHFSRKELLMVSDCRDENQREKENFIFCPWLAPVAQEWNSCRVSNRRKKHFVANDRVQRGLFFSAPICGFSFFRQISLLIDVDMRPCLFSETINCLGRGKTPRSKVTMLVLTYSATVLFFYSALGKKYSSEQDAKIFLIWILDIQKCFYSYKPSLKKHDIYSLTQVSQVNSAQPPQ